MRWVVLLALVAAGCATVYVVTGHESSITSEREVSQTVGRQKLQKKDDDDKKD